MTCRASFGSLPLFVAIHTVLHLDTPKELNALLAPDITVTVPARSLAFGVYSVAEKNEIGQLIDALRRDLASVVAVTGLTLG